MNTDFLRSFVAVVDLGSFTAAARQLFLTPAAVAQRIHALESELGAELLARAGRNVLPTSAGYAILEQARRFVAEVEDLKILAQGGAVAGSIKVGGISTALTGIFPEVLRLLITRYPRLEFHISPGTSTDLFTRLTNGELDACLLVRPPFEFSKALNWRTLRTEPLVLLTQNGEVVDSVDEVLRKKPFIRYDRMHWGGQLADNYLRRQNLQTVERLELDALEAIAVMVDRGLGASLVPDWCNPWPNGLSLAKYPVPDSIGEFARNIGLLWHRNGPRAHLVQAFLSICVESARHRANTQAKHGSATR